MSQKSPNFQNKSDTEDMSVSFQQNLFNSKDLIGYQVI